MFGDPGGVRPGTFHTSPTGERFNVGGKFFPHPSGPGRGLLFPGDRTRTTPDFTVDTNAKVLCGNVQTANATVHIVDTVLMPAS